MEAYISRGYFLYSKIRNVPLAPTRTTVPWDALHSNIKELFVRCFDNGHTDPQSRPEPKEWSSALEQTMKDLRQCNVNPNHWYFGNRLNSTGSMGCTWCIRPIEAFPIQYKTTSPISASVHKAPGKPSPVQKPKPKKSTKSLPTPSYKFIDQSNTPKWIRARINSIYKRPVQGNAGEIVVYRFKGKRYRYRLEFSVLKNWWKRDWGPVVVYRKPRTWFWKKLNN